MSSEGKNTAIGSTVGSIAGAFFGPAGSAIGGSLGGLLGSAFGGSGFKRPPGTIGTDQIVKLLQQGLSFDDILAQGLPFVPRHQQKAVQKLTRAGLDPQQIAQLRNPAASGAGAGPFGIPAFQSLLPALAGNPALFSNPAAAGFLSSLFPSAPAQTPAPSPLPLPLGLPGGFNPFGGAGKPGPSPNPTVGLRALSGPFGNGGGPISPTFGARGGPSVFRGLLR